MKKFDLKTLLAGVVLLLVAYGVGSRALDTGSYWEYLGCLVALIFSIKLIVQAVRNQRDGKTI